MPNARYERTAMPRLRPSTTEHVASAVMKTTIQHCVFTLKSHPILPSRHGTELPHAVLRMRVTLEVYSLP